MTLFSPLARCPLVFSSLVTLLIFISSAGVGWQLLRALRLDIPDTLERGLFALTLGLGALTFLPFLLFAFGMGHSSFVSSSLFLLAVCFWREEFRVLRSAARGLMQALREWRAHGPAWTWFLAAVTAPLLLVTLLQAFCPPTDPDGLHYHMTAPLRYLALGRFAYLPTFLHVNWPLGVEMLFALGFAFSPYYAVALIQYGIGLLLLLAAYALGRRLVSPAVGWLTAILLLSWIRGEMTWAYIDLGLTLYGLMSVMAFFIGWQSLQPLAIREDWGRAGCAPAARPVWWTLSAILAGLTATAKLPGILTVGLMAVMVFATLWRPQAGESKVERSARLRDALRPAVQYLAIGIAIALPWYLKAWATTNDPFYPYLWKIFGAKDWDAEAQQRFTLFFQTMNSFHASNFSPQKVIALRAIACLILLGLGIVLCNWRGTRLARPLFVFLFASAFLQAATSGVYMRFFLPLIPFVLVLAFWLLRHGLARSTAIAWAAAGCVAFGLWGLWRLPSMLKWALATTRDTLPVAIGKTSRDAYLLPRLANYNAIHWANTHLPPDATITLGIWDAHAALVERRTLVTNMWLQSALHFDSTAHLLADLRRLRATHLLLHEETKTPAEIAAMSAEEHLRQTEEFPKLRAVAAAYGNLIYSANQYQLFALDLAKSNPAPQADTNSPPSVPRLARR